ncbi:hypothetical protein [Hamadaea tsunoensis]|uniref:hypothetical protein n=1 Tax=Hamadaea tsunoensis TaxID=53368 RepID=UPI000414CAB2|nr:hypothetical protein [Hamadaea tsunoensis]
MTSPDLRLLGFPVYRALDRFQTTTRQLCAGAYLEPGFGETVIRELVEDERRAVAPSFGFDVEPVVRHALRARRLRLATSFALAVLVLVGLRFTPVFTVGWLAIGFVVAGWRTPLMRALSPRTRRWVVLGVLGAVGAAVCCIAGSLLFALFGVLQKVQSAMGTSGTGGVSGTSASAGGSGADQAPPDLGSLAALLIPLALAVLTFGVLLAYRLRVNAILATELAADRPGFRPETHSDRVRRRLAKIAAAQYGNIVVHERDPFLGCGMSVSDGSDDWSFALRLRPAEDGGGPVLPLGELTDGLYGGIRSAVEGMRDAGLPEGARIANLEFLPHLVADGRMDVDDPLLSPDRRMPYAYAADELIDAIRRCPQGGLRYYERIVVSGPGNPVRTGAGTEVLPPRVAGVDISVFVHVAVEGGMLYTEFLSRVLPPVRERFELVDTMRPRVAGWLAVREALRAMPADSAASGWRILTGLARMARTGLRMAASGRDTELSRVHDYGARLSVRAAAADPVIVKYLQLLDTAKYVKLIERAVSESILRFLQDGGYDIAEFAQRVNHIQNFHGDLTFHGGQQAFGGTSTFHQN